MKINKNSLLKLASISLTLVLFVVSAQGQGECAPGQYWGAARVINNPLVCGSSPAGVCRGIASKQNAQDNPDYSYRMQEYWFSTVHNNGVCHIRNFPPEGPGNGYSEGMASSDVNHFLDASDGLFAVDDQQDNGMSCPSEGNPINPANGNKFQTELDYRSGGSDALKFIRTYNSASDINAEMGSNWVHNYHRRVSVRNKFAVGHIPNNPYHSPKYTDNVQACESGWNFVKDSLPDGIGDNAYAVYVSSASFDGTCQIKSSDNHDIIGSLPIRNVVSLAVEPDLLDSVSITRPDGKSYYFKYLGYTSNSTPHFSSQNTRATLSEVFVYDAQLNETVELKLVDEDDNIEIYDTNYRLKSIETRSGYKTTFEYDGSDRLERVTNHHGLELNIAYDANDRIDYVTDPAGQTIQYGYTGDNLTSVTYQNGESKTYIYDDSSHPNALKGILNERGHRVSSWEYDSEGRAYISYNGPMLDPVGRIELNFISSIETEVTCRALS